MCTLFFGVILLDPLSAKVKPNLLHILLDDFGWADAGWHRPEGYLDVQSNNMNALVKDGIETYLPTELPQPVSELEKVAYGRVGARLQAARTNQSLVVKL